MVSIQIKQNRYTVQDSVIANCYLTTYCTVLHLTPSSLINDKMCKRYMKQNNIHVIAKYSVEYKISMCLITHAFSNTCNVDAVLTLNHTTITLNA